MELLRFASTKDTHHPRLGDILASVGILSDLVRELGRPRSRPFTSGRPSGSGGLSRALWTLVICPGVSADLRVPGAADSHLSWVSICTNTSSHENTYVRTYVHTYIHTKAHVFTNVIFTDNSSDCVVYEYKTVIHTSIEHDFTEDIGIKWDNHWHFK